MIRRTIGNPLFATAAVLCAVLLASAVPALAQEPAAQAPPQPSPEEMAAAMQAMTPGSMHEELQYFVGDWTIEMQMYMGPGAPPMASTGKMTARSIHDGRFVKASFRGTVMGMPFEGEALDGYDNLKEEFVSTWHDSMNTGIMYYTGTCDTEDCSKRTMTGSGVDPMSGETMKVRDILTIVDENTYRFESLASVGGAPEYKTMEFTARRKTE